MRNVVMIGPQGSGKGTQSDLLARRLGIPRIGLGSLFRAEVAKGSELGAQAKGYMDRGEIVPSEIADKVMSGRLSESDAANGAILDAFPRTLEQADALENIFRSLGRELTDAIYLRISDEEAVRRLSGRRVCSNATCEHNYHLQFDPPRGNPEICDKCGAKVVQRADDVPDAIKRRLQIYHQETVPLIALYQGLNILREIDGGRPIDDVQAEICKAMGL